MLMAREKTGARKPAEINPIVDSRLSAGDEHGLGGLFVEPISDSKASAGDEPSLSEFYVEPIDEPFVPVQTNDATFFSLASGTFTQDWSNTGLITTNDSSSGVTDIIGYLGQDITTSSAGVDPQTLLTDSLLANDIDVIANQGTNTANISGGVAEFAGL